MPTHCGQAADPATLTGLAHSEMQLLDRNLQSEAKGAGAILRVLPISLLPVDEDQTVAVIAAKVAALTHGSAEAIQVAATVAVLARAALAYRSISEAPLADAVKYASQWAETLPDNSSIPGDGEYIRSDLSVQASSSVEQDDITSLTVLTQLVDALVQLESTGAKLPVPETAHDQLLYALWLTIAALSGHTTKTDFKVHEDAQDAVDLLERQWHKELGIA